jgi:ferrochelatase
MKRIGLLLINLGSPSSTAIGDVRRYLSQFLSDPRVIDLPAPARFLLLHGVILRVRPSRSAALYKRIWTERGSPLIFHTRDLANRLESSLDRSHPEEYSVQFAMRYGSPSMDEALAAFERDGIHEIIAMPLYPQYSSATTGSTLEELYRLCGQKTVVPSLRTIAPFYNHPAFFRAYAGMAREHLNRRGFKPDHTLFTFHGLPESHIRSAVRDGGCLREGCCETKNDRNRLCYRAQCFATADLIAREMELKKGSWSVSFQSRMGRTPWIAPYTDETIRAIAASGCRSLAVMAPSFVADCLETLEEIDGAGGDIFRREGGEEFFYIPAPNSDPAWVKALLDILGIG